MTDARHVWLVGSSDDLLDSIWTSAEAAERRRQAIDADMGAAWAIPMPLDHTDDGTCPVCKRFT